MRRLAFSAFLIGSVAGTTLFAGDNNSVDLLQISTGQIGNTLSIDQSDANNAVLAGDRLAITPARQLGDGNVADLTIAGEGGQIGFGQSGQANAATVSILGANGFGQIEQLGNLNNATLNVDSGSLTAPADGLIAQFGNRNTATLNVRGTNASGELIQVGSGNTNTLTVDGPDASVVFTQVGRNLTNAGVNGVEVFTNGSVSITQTNFGTFN